jgi:hypothetical protein
MQQRYAQWLQEEAWEAFKEMRKLKGQRAPFTQRAESLVLKRLEEFHRQGYDTGWILEDAVINGWSSVYVNNRTPMRDLSTGEKQSAAKIIQMASGAVKR